MVLTVWVLGRLVLGSLLQACLRALEVVFWKFLGSNAFSSIHERPEIYYGTMVTTRMIEYSS